MDAMSCLAAPPPAAYADAAIARALHFSMADSPASSSSSASTPSRLLADLAGGYGFASALAPAMVTCESVLVADSAARAAPSPGPVARTGKQIRLAPAGGRAGKRRPRASKRAPTTYISTDPANFRLMVQHITGVQAEPAHGVLMQTTSLDASTVLLAAADSTTPPFGADDAAPLHHHHHQHHQPPPCFPTLDSWSVMYESSELL